MTYVTLWGESEAARRNRRPFRRKKRSEVRRMQKQKLPPTYLDKLAEYHLEGLDLSAALLIRYEPGEWFLHEQQPIEYLYFLVSGKAKVCMSARSGRSLLLCYYVSEGIIGDVELLAGWREAISSMQATTALTCVALPLSVYAPVLRANLPFILRVGAGLSEKLRASTANCTSIILQPFERRLCGYLLQSAPEGRFGEHLTDVSEQLGVSYRHLLRSLKALCEEGLLEKRKDCYVLLDKAELEKRALE
jgi:CRP-like cAMP-binding protein